MSEAILKAVDDAEHYATPISLDTFKLPDMPADIFPGWFGEMIEAVAEATETPRELSAMLGLAVIATCCQKKFIIKPKQGYIEPLNIWTVAALESGNRKTSVVQAMTQPLIEWEKEKADIVKIERAKAESELKTIEARISSLRCHAAKAKPHDLDSIKGEIISLETSLPEIPIIPSLWSQDITPEKVGSKMGDQGEKLAILSDEGGIFDIMAGRYNGGVPNIDVFLQAHAGAAIRVDRGSRPPVYMRHPALTIGLSPQPEVLKGLASNSGFRGRGLLARFLYVLPKSCLGFRLLNTKPVPEHIGEAYNQGIKALLETPSAKNEEGESIAHILKLSEEAYGEWKEFAHTVEVGLRPGGRYEYITDWAGKLPGAAARIAGLFHCAIYAHTDPWEFEVSQEIMSKALTLAATLTEHSLAVFDLMGADPALEDAKRVWKWIERTGAETFKARDCFDAHKGHFRRMSHIEPAFDVLIERNYVFELDRKEPLKPGRPSRSFITNPTITEGWK